MLYLRAILIWILMMLAEMAHAILRNMFLMPAVGDLRARQISVFSGSLIIFAITWVFVQWLKAPSKEDRLRIGLLWVSLTIAFEISLGRFVFDYGWPHLLADYDLLHGGLMPLGLLAMFLSPLAAAALRCANNRILARC